MNQQEWKNRWETLNKAIGNARNIPISEEYPHKNSFNVIFANLQAFAKKQFDFFNNGFNGFEGNPPFLTISPAYPAEYALRQTIDQIEYDLSVLRNARNQRLSSLNEAEEVEALSRADKLTYKALQPMFSCFLDAESHKNIRLLKHTTALTYFQKSPSVRVIPYAPVALIGIPQTCADFEENPQDFLAIPHEVGHYVFWHAERNKIPLWASLHLALPPEPAWRHAWLEEIFADVYGCLVAGPAIVCDFQDMMMDNRDLREDDGKHPIGALRPYVYTDTLRELHRLFGNFLASPKVLDDRWEEMLKERTPVVDFIPKAGDGTAVNLTDARQIIREAIHIILKNLQPILENFAQNRWTTEDQADSLNKINDDLYDNFKTGTLATLNEENHVPQLITEVTEAATQMTQSDCTDDYGAMTELESKVLDTQSYWLDLFAEALSRNGLRLPPSVWTGLLVNGGWAVGGPESGTNPPG